MRSFEFIKGFVVGRARCTDSSLWNFQETRNRACGRVIIKYWGHWHLEKVVAPRLSACHGKISPNILWQPNVFYSSSWVQSGWTCACVGCIAYEGWQIIACESQNNWWSVCATLISRLLATTSGRTATAWKRLRGKVVGSLATILLGKDAATNLNQDGNR